MALPSPHRVDVVRAGAPVNRYISVRLPHPPLHPPIRSASIALPSQPSAAASRQKKTTRKEKRIKRKKSRGRAGQDKEGEDESAGGRHARCTIENCRNGRSCTSQSPASTDTSRRHHRQGVAGGRCSTPTAVPVGPRHRRNREGGGGVRRGGAVAAAGCRFTARRSPRSLPRSAPPAAAAPGGRLRRHRDDAHGRWVPTRPTRGREVPLANCTALRAGRRFRGRERAATYEHASNFETLLRSNLHRLNAGQRVTADRVIAQRSWCTTRIEVAPPCTRVPAGLLTVWVAQVHRGVGLERCARHGYRSHEALPVAPLANRPPHARELFRSGGSVSPAGSLGTGASSALPRCSPSPVFLPPSPSPPDTPASVS